MNESRIERDQRKFNTRVARVGLAFVRIIVGLSIAAGLVWLWPLVKPWLRAITA